METEQKLGHQASDLCWTSLSKGLTADKGRSGPKGKVICSGLLEAGVNSIYSDDI